jgi:hypothetical protein
VAVVLITVGHGVNTLIHLPAGLSMTDQEAVMAHFKENPPTTARLIGVLLTYAVAAFVGGLLAALIAGWAPRGHGVAIGVLLTVSGLMNLLSIPHPAWFWVVNLAEFIPAAVLGSMLIRSKGSDQPTPPGQP